ncbi:UNVERIFIED_CONTAM: hypothetical protein FKN15_077019 [Acipenser sinensis]
MHRYKRLGEAIFDCIVPTIKEAMGSQLVIHVTGRLRIRLSLTHGRTVPIQIMGMVVIAHALPPPTINEVRIDCQMFVTRVNMDLNIVYCENRISDYMDLTPVDIVGKRCYHFIHAEDVEGIRHSHLDCEYCNMLLLAVQDMCYSCTLKKCILKLKSYYDRRLQLAERVNGAAHEEQIK